MYRKVVVASTCLLLLHVPAIAQNRPFDPDEGALSSVKPRIPEPMVFDLIRPLGAERGEFEVNSLFGFSPKNRPRRLHWAPEIEYAFLQGHGVEFELPMENGYVESWKGAIQGTLPGPWKKSFIQGWQGLGEVHRETKASRINALYLAGLRWHPRWSVFSMTGFEHEREHRTGHAFLGNYTLFYHHRKALTYGLETNFKGTGISGRSVLLMPQVQFRKDRINFQVGAGWRSHENVRGPQIGWRLSREF